MSVLTKILIPIVAVSKVLGSCIVKQWMVNDRNYEE